MKIFITVGSTKFTELIEACDLQFANSPFRITAQIGTSAYRPYNLEYFEFTDKINSYYSEADIVVCHAGAGTIFSLLEMRKKMVVVPNLNLADDHQKEIGNFLIKNNYAEVCFDLQNLNDKVLLAAESSYNSYSNNSKALIDAISSIICKE